MAKTIKEIAEEIGVSKQAVFKKINQVPLSTEIEKFISTVNGKKLVSVDGEILIKQAFQRKQKRKQKTVDVNVDAKDDGKKFTVGDMVDGIPSKSQEQENTLAAAFQTAIDALTRQLEEKDRQLAEKDKLLEWQTKTIEELATSLAVAQHTAQAAQALHAGTLQRQIEDVPIMQAEEMKVATETAEEIMPEYEKGGAFFLEFSEEDKSILCTIYEE